jgi:hypothetical protein
MSTKVLPCNGCPKHAYQDAKYGPGMRVHNEVKGKTSNIRTWRCSVNEKEQDAK